jgi:hypothetical protein
MNGKFFSNVVCYVSLVVVLVVLQGLAWAYGIIGDQYYSSGKATVTGSGSQWNNSSDLTAGVLRLRLAVLLVSHPVVERRR